MPTTRPTSVSAQAVTASRLSAIATRPGARLKLLFLITGQRSMADLSGFQQYYRLADALIEGATKEDLAECARLLALNLAHYQGKFGVVPLVDSLADLGATETNDEQAVLLKDGMEILVGVLGSVMSGLGEEKH